MANQIIKSIELVAKAMQDAEIKKELIFDKNGNPFKQSKSSDILMNALKPLMVQHNIVASATVENTTITPLSAGVHVFLAIKYTLSSTIDNSSVSSVGIACASGQDASSCAYTIAYKNAMALLFNVHFDALTSDEIQELKLMNDNKKKGGIPQIKAPAPADNEEQAIIEELEKATSYKELIIIYQNNCSDPSSELSARLVAYCRKIKEERRWE